MSGFDDLLAGGIVNYDSEAYVKGYPPRFLGNPCSSYSAYSPLDAPLVYPPPVPYGIMPGPYIAGAPVNDAFNGRYHYRREHHTSLPAVLTAAFVGALAVWSGCKIKTSFFPAKAAKEIEKDTVKIEKEKPVKEEGKFGNWLNNTKEKIFSKKEESKTTPEEIIEAPKADKLATVENKSVAPKSESTVANSVKNTAKDVKKGSWKPFKTIGIAALAGVGIFALYEGFKFIKARNERIKEMQSMQNSQTAGNAEPTEQVQPVGQMQAVDDAAYAQSLPADQSITPAAQTTVPIESTASVQPEATPVQAAAPINQTNVPVEQLPPQQIPA